MPIKNIFQKWFQKKKLFSKELKLSVRNKKAQVTFDPNFSKTITEEQKQDFWKRYFSQESMDFIKKRSLQKKPVYISSWNPNILIFKVTPTILGTVRKMNYKEYTKYLESYNFLTFKASIFNQKLKLSEVIINDIISKKNINDTYYILEKILPSISVRDFKEYTFNYREREKFHKVVNRYLPSFVKSLKEQNISIKQFYTDLERAVIECQKVIGNITDIDENNIIILGYNKKKGKFKFGLIDFFGYDSKSI